MKPIEQLSYIFPAVSDVVEGIRPDQLDLPTPCSTFTVRDILDHMLVLGGAFAYAFRGEPAPDIAPLPRNGRVPAGEVRATLDALLDAARSRGAMQRTIETPMGGMPGETFVRFLAFDGAVHGWDLAVATGQKYDIADDLVDEIDRFARAAITDAMRDGDTFKARTVAPDGASRLEQLVAFSGRTLS